MAGAIVVIGGLAGCGQDGADDAAEATGLAPDQAPVTVSEAWTREPAATQTRAAVYATLTNQSDGPVQVVSASSSLTDQVELHETVSGDGGAMSMREVSDGFTIPAGEQFRFEAGGPHIMLMGIDPASFPGDHIEITLAFDSGPPVIVEADVEALTGASDDHDHDHHDHGDDHDDHDHGDDKTSGDHDHGDHDHGDHADGETADSSEAAPADDPLSVKWLHELDDELMAGTIDPERQRGVVGPFIAYYEGLDAEAGTLEADLLAVLRELDDALADDDLTLATSLATEAHNTAHALEDDHDH
ncbi:MAG: copper chaperone PCu(A)C [Actinomycetota bacterium]